MGIECWCVMGYGLPEGISTYVLMKENANTNEICLKNQYKNSSKSILKQINWRYCIFDATTGKKFDIKDPFCPLQKIYFLCNDENVSILFSQ